MARRTISRSALHRAETAPKRRRAKLSVTPLGTVKLGGQVDRPVVWFEANHYAADGVTGKAWRSDTEYTITTFVDGVPSLLVYVTDRRVASVTFSMALTPYQLDLAIRGLRRYGLGRLILPALRETQRQMREHGRETPALRAYFRGVLRAPRSGTRNVRRF